MTVRIILKRSFAQIVFGICAGRTIPCPVSKKIDFPSMTTSALPSITCRNVSNGDIFSVPAYYDDLLTIKTFVEKVTHVKLVHRYEVRRDGLLRHFSLIPTA